MQGEDEESRLSIQHRSSPPARVRPHAPRSAPSSQLLVEPDADVEHKSQHKAGPPGRVRKRQATRAAADTATDVSSSGVQSMPADERLSIQHKAAPARRKRQAARGVTATDERGTSTFSDASQADAGAKLPGNGNHERVSIQHKAAAPARLKRQATRGRMEPSSSTTCSVAQLVPEPIVLDGLKASEALKASESPTAPRDADANSTLGRPHSTSVLKMLCCFVVKSFVLKRAVRTRRDTMPRAPRKV